MSEQFSVKAILSADASNFNSVFGSAVSTLSGFDKLTGGLTGSLGNVTSMVKSGLGFGILQGIGQKAFSVVADGVSKLTSNLGGAISRYDTLKQFPKTMELMGYKTEDTEKATNKLIDAIDGLPTSLDGITKNTQSIALITGDLDGATDTAIALNNAFLMSGSSTAEAERGLTQYVQMMSAGKVDMQSWRTLLETMSPALNKVAESFGYTGESAKNDLYNALQSGEITFSEFNARIVEMNDGIDIAGDHFEGFAALSKTSTEGIGTSIENLKTTVVKQLAKMIEAFDNSGISIAAGLNGIKDKMNAFANNLRESTLFQHLIDSTKNTIEAIKSAMDTFTNSSAMKAVYDNIDRITLNLGIILPNVIKALEPIIEAVAKVATGVLAAISDVIAEVTSNPAFIKFCENIGKAIEKVGDIVSSVISHLTPFITAILDAANEVMAAFGKALDAIMKTARETNTAGKLYENFNKVLGFVKDALIKVAQFLEKHHTWILKIIEHLPQIIALIFAVKTALAVLEKIRAFKALIDQVVDFGKQVKGMVENVKSGVGKVIDCFKNIFGSTQNTAAGFTSFASVAKGAISNVEGYMGNMGTASYTVGNNITQLGGSFTKVEGVAGNATMLICNNMGGLATAAQQTGSGIATGLSGGFSGALSSALSVAGPIIGAVAGIGTAIFGIVTAIKKWREEQYKAGQEAEKFTEDQQATIDKNNELVNSYDELRESTKKTIEDHEAESAYAAALRDEYNKLIDANGNVIEGKEKQAETIRSKLYEALGIEYGTIQDLQNEYKNLLDDNGNVISGYEDRAAEIRGNLSEALGKEISDTQAVMGIDQDLMGTIDELIEKKRLEAEASVLSDAWIESEKKKKELYNEQLEMVDLLRDEQGKYYDFLKEQGVEREEDLKRLSSDEQGRFDRIKENLESLEGDLDRNARAQERCETDKQIAMDATAAVAEGDYARMNTLMEQYTGDLVSAKDAVRDYSDTAIEKLTEQAENAEIKYQEIKAAYDKGEAGATETLVKEAEARRDFANEQLESMYTDTSIHYEKTLQDQMQAAEDEYNTAKEHYSRLASMNEEERRRTTDGDLKAAKERLENAENSYRDSETAYTTYMNNLNAEGSTQLSRLTQTTDVETKNMAQMATANTAEMNNGVIAAISPLDPMVTSIVGRTMKNSNNELATGGAVLAATAGTATTAITSEVGKLETNVPSSMDKAMSGSKQAVLNHKGEIGAATSSVVNEIGNEANKMQNTIPTAAGNAMTATGNTIRASGVAQEIVTIRDLMAGYMDYLSSQFKISAQNAMIGLQNGLNARAGNVYNTAQVIANNIAATINAALQIHSPSRVMAFTGRMIDEGLMKGMDDYGSKVGRVAEGIADMTVKSFDEVNNIIAFPDISDMSRGIPSMRANANMELNPEYNYNGSFQATIEVPVNIDKRVVSRITVDTDSEEQYYNQKRYYR